MQNKCVNYFPKKAEFETFAETSNRKNYSIFMTKKFSSGTYATFLYHAAIDCIHELLTFGNEIAILEIQNILK